MRTSLRQKLTYFLCAWFILQISFSGASFAPEMQIVQAEKNSDEYKVLKQLQEIMLELQVLELAVKNRHNQRIEAKLSEALKSIHENGHNLEPQFAVLNQEQIKGLEAFIKTAKQYSDLIHIKRESFDTLLTDLKTGKIQEGTLSLPSSFFGRSFTLFQLTPLRMGHQLVWRISLPATSPANFWHKARALAQHRDLPWHSIAKITIEEKVADLNGLYADAEAKARHYYSESFNRMYATFEEQRFGLFQRVATARKALLTLSRNSNSLNAPEESSALFNQVLENLFQYGVNVSLVDGQRDFSMQGFLFAPTPEEAQKLLEKLRFTPSS